jgi:glycosyltransferase involved in cell wall biosynthesis
MDFIPNGVQPEVWASGDQDAGRRYLRLEPDDFLVSYIGTVGMAHGVGTVLEAAGRAKMEAPRVRFLVVGDGAERPELEREGVERGLDNVLFTESQRFNESRNARSTSAILSSGMMPAGLEVPAPGASNRPGSSDRI